MQKILCSSAMVFLALHFIPAAWKIPKTTNLSSAETPVHTAFSWGGVENTFTNNFKNRSCRLPLTPADSTPANCYWDMRGYIFADSDIVKTGKIYYGKNAPPNTIPNYYDASYSGDKIDSADGYQFDDDRNPCYNEDGCTQVGTSLYYTVYYPKHNYLQAPLYAVALFHAGGFSDCSGPNYEDEFCRDFARKGFIVFNIEYRRGRIKNTIDGRTSVQQMEAMYRAFQDGRGALRSIIKNQQVNTNLPYLFVEDSIFVMGQSAGGTIAANITYYPTQAMNDSIFKTPAGLTPISTALGPINADFYIGDTTIDYHSKIIGTCEMWAGFPFSMAVSDASTEYNFLTQNGAYTPAPMIAFMGAKDQVFPFYKEFQYYYYSLKKNAKFTTDSLCMISSPYKIYGNKTDKNGRIECTNDIFKLFKANGIPTLFYLDCDMGHGLDRDDNNPNTPYKTNFGLPDSVGLILVNQYIASRSCFFFQSILNGTAGSLAGTQKFVDCEDYRHSSGSCATAADNNNCNANDNCNDSL